MKGVSLDLWELIATAQDTYRGTLYLCLAGIPRLWEEPRLKRIRKALIREKKSDYRTLFTLDGKLHQEDNFPAMIYYDGSKDWWKNGKQYRNKHISGY